MKKRLSIISTAALAACLSLLALAGCSSTGTTSGDDTSSTEAIDFVVGFDSGYPPYGYIADDGSYTGFDLELAQEVCNRNGWTFTATPIDWDAKDAELNQGSITCIWNGFTHEGREDQYAFSGDYMVNAQVVVVRADSGISSLEDLAGKTVMTQVESAALDVLQGDQAELAATFSGGAAQTISDYNQAFMQLESGLVDAVACDLSIAAYQMSAKPDVYTQLSPSLSEEHYAVGFALGNEDLAQTVTDTLKAMDEDGTVEALCAKYEDQGISYSNWCLE